MSPCGPCILYAVPLTHIRLVVVCQACVTFADFAGAIGEASAQRGVPVTAAEHAAVFAGVLAASAELRRHTLRALAHFPFPAADAACVAALWVATHDSDEV